MKNLVSILVCVLLLAVAFVPADPSYAQELYGWTISASSTDPFVHTAPPETGLYNLYAWLVCITSEVFGSGGFHIDGTLADRILGFTAIPPFGLVVASNFDVAPFIDEGECLSSGTHLAFRILVLDESGIGGSLCIVETDSGANGSCNCDQDPVLCFPNAVTGFASDGTDPCVSGFCQLPPILNVPESWGATKAKYRD